jgi:hypothetical protein
MTCRYCQIAGYLDEAAADYGPDEQAVSDIASWWRGRCRCRKKNRPVDNVSASHPAVPHAVHLRLREDAARHGRGIKGSITAANDWLATHLALIFGVCWTIWIFFTVPLIAPYLGATAESKIFFYSSGWLQLFALPLMVYVGNKLQRSSDLQSGAMHQALTHIATVEDQNAQMLSRNTDLTRQIHELAQQIHQKMSDEYAHKTLPIQDSSDLL